VTAFIIGLACSSKHSHRQSAVPAEPNEIRELFRQARPSEADAWTEVRSADTGVETDTSDDRLDVGVVGSTEAATSLMKLSFVARKPFETFLIISADA